MNGQSFVAVNRAFSHHSPRRTALAKLAVGAISGLLASAGVHGARLRSAAAQSATPLAGASAYSVIRRYQLRPEASMDDLVERVNEGFVPIVSKNPGFQEHLIVDSGGYAPDNQPLRRSQRRGTVDPGRRGVGVAELIEGPPEVTAGWVRIHIDADSAP